MFRSFRIGSLAGIDIYLHWTFLLLLGFFLLSGLAAGQGLAASVAGVGFVMALFGCVVLHELGHALAARRYGIPTRDITLLPIGGVARLERIPERPSEELVVALAGPAVNVVIAAALAMLLGPFGGLGGLLTGETFLHGLLRVNLMLVAFNLLPAFPMDGGRVLRSLLAMRMDYVRATDAAARVGQVMAVLFALVGLFVVFNPFLLLVGIFVFFGAAAESAQARMRSAAASHPGSAASEAWRPSGPARPAASRSWSAPAGPVGDTVADFMVHRFRVARAGDRLAEIAGDLQRSAQRSFPVVDEGRLVGMLRHSDLPAVGSAAADLRAADVMRRDIVTAEATENLRPAVRRLLDSGHDTLAVLHEGRLVGLLQVREEQAATTREDSAAAPTGPVAEPAEVG